MASRYDDDWFEHTRDPKWFGRGYTDFPDLEDAYLEDMTPGANDERFAQSPFRSRCPHCERSFSDPEQRKTCSDCGMRSGVFMRSEEDEAA